MIPTARTTGFGRRTLQGGDGRSTGAGGVPNVRGQGIMQQFLGANPVGGFGSASVGARRTQPGRSGMFQMPRPMGGAGGRRMTPPGPPQRGRGGGVGGGRANILGRMGMPLDPMFEGDRRQWQDAYAAQMTALRNARQTGGAMLDENAMLANRGLDEDMSNRGLFGSGIEKRGERLIGNDLARGQLDLLNQFTSGQSAAQMDRRRAHQEALLALARRQQSNRYLPIPKRNGGGNRRRPQGGGARRGRAR